MPFLTAKNVLNFLTKNPLAILFQSEDTTYILADTLFAISDTLQFDEFMRAHYQVRIFCYQVSRASVIRWLIRKVIR
jgi:hypothetical protein